MISDDRFAFASEFYVVEKTVELVANHHRRPQRIRIEVLYDPRRSKYSTKTYIQDAVFVLRAGTDITDRSITLFTCEVPPASNWDSADAALTEGYYRSWWIEKEKGHTLRITTKSYEGVAYAPRRIYPI